MRILEPIPKTYPRRERGYHACDYTVRAQLAVWDPNNGSSHRCRHMAKFEHKGKKLCPAHARSVALMEALERDKEPGHAPLTLSPKACVALARLHRRTEATWAVLRELGAQLSHLKELERAGLAEHDPTSKGDARRWRITTTGEARQARLLEHIGETTIHD